MTKKTDVRIERDRIGEVQVPAHAYYGAQTVRAREVCQVTTQRVNARLIDALVIVKKSAANANASVGRLDATIARTVGQACDEVLAGQWRDQFIADPLHFGAGVTIIANVNEVLANRSNQLLGGNLGTYERVHPDEHLNLGQSTSDVFPAAMRLALLLGWRELEPLLLDLERLLRRKSLEFEKVAKVGRTHLQDNVPITLGQEFNAYGSSVERGVRRIKDATQHLYETNLGFTSVGTGFGADPEFPGRVIETLNAASGMKFRHAEDVFRATHSMADFVEFSSSLKELAVELQKISTDLRLLASGPYAGFGEIRIPSVFSEPSDLSPILPDKQHPYLTECLSMVCYQVLANDTVVAMCAQSGQLDSNSMTPLLIHASLQSLEILKGSLAAFNTRCVAGITADAKRCQELLELSGATAAAIGVYLGPEKAADLWKQVKTTGKSVRELILEQKLLSAEVLDRILHYRSLTRPSNVPIGGAKPGTTSSTRISPIDNS